MGCGVMNRVIKFPGLLERNVVQVFKESKDYKEEPFEGFSFENKNKYPAFKSVKIKSFDHQLREKGSTSQTPVWIAIQVRGRDTEVKVLIEQVQQNVFLVEFDIIDDDFADNDKQVRQFKIL
jgi:hypothetical protein